MLNLIEVCNIQFSSLKEQVFDIGIFASGYESRCTYLAKSLSIDKIRYKLILGFNELKDNAVRKSSDNYYLSHYGDIHAVSSKDEKDIYTLLLTLFDKLKKDEEINILIDYTSMSRLWYLGILNFIRFQVDVKINVFLNYSLGKYTNNYLDYSYSSINSLPSHEGSLSSNNKTLLALGIGFSPYLVKSVIEEIEPNNIIGILALPNIKKKYEAQTLKIKNDILTKDIEDWVNCPLDNLESIFRTFTEIISNNMNDKDVIFLSLGPKIFTLASILVSQRFEQVTCLYLKYSNLQALDVKPTGDFICNKVVYKP